MNQERVVSKHLHSWSEEDDVIYFCVTSSGTTGEDWIERLESEGFRVDDYAKSVLRSPDFKPTSGITTEVAVLRDRLFKNDDRTTKKIRAEAEKRKLVNPNAETACLIREKFMDEDIKAMDLLYIVVMHQPILGSAVSHPGLLCVNCDYEGHCFSSSHSSSENVWNRGVGFAFAVPFS